MLECYLAEPGPFRLKALADRLQVEKATLYRYCVTLQEYGYLDFDQSTKEYSLGQKARELGLAARRQSDLLGVIHAWLPVLAERYQGSASFGVLAGSHVVYVDRAITEGALGYSLSIGARLRFERSSIGTVVAAYLDDDQREALLADVADAELRKEVEEAVFEARTQGFGLNVGRSRPEVNSVAVLVRNPATAQVVGGINIAVSAQSRSLKQLRDKVGPDLLKVAERIAHNQLPNGNQAGDPTAVG